VRVSGKGSIEKAQVLATYMYESLHHYGRMLDKIVFAKTMLRLIELETESQKEHYEKESLKYWALATNQHGTHHEQCQGNCYSVLNWHPLIEKPKPGIS
jgi:hypothetical protein